MATPLWLPNLSRAFKAHRLGRPGWFLEVHRDRIRLTSTELPPRPDEPAGKGPRKRALTLSTPPGPATAAAALAEACAIFDAVQTSDWTWPDPDAPPSAENPSHLHPSTLARLMDQLRDLRGRSPKWLP